MYVNLYDADVLISNNFISTDTVNRLGRDAIKLVLDNDKNFNDANIGLNDFSDIDKFFTTRVFIYDTMDDVNNARLYDDYGDNLYIIKTIPLDDGRILVVYDI